MAKKWTLKDCLDWAQHGYWIGGWLISLGLGRVCMKILARFVTISPDWRGVIWLVMSGLLIMGATFLIRKIWPQEVPEVSPKPRIEPDFVLGISDALWEYNAQKNKTLFFIHVSVINRGDDSVAIGWGARFIVGDSEEEMTSHWIIGEWVVSIGSTQVALTTEDLLDAKTRENPVQRGHLRQGRLFFAIEGNRLPQIDARNFKIQVRCSDINLKTYTEIYDPLPTNNSELVYAHTEKAKKLKPPPEK